MGGRELGPVIDIISEYCRWSGVALRSAARGARGGGAERGEHELPAGGAATERPRGEEAKARVATHIAG